MERREFLRGIAAAVVAPAAVRVEQASFLLWNYRPSKSPAGSYSMLSAAEFELDYMTDLKDVIYDIDPASVPFVGVMQRFEATQRVASLTMKIMLEDFYMMPRGEEQN
jgi:hypothetical protein